MILTIYWPSSTLQQVPRTLYQKSSTSLDHHYHEAFQDNHSIVKWLWISMKTCDNTNYCTDWPSSTIIEHHRHCGLRLPVPPCAMSLGGRRSWWVPTGADSRSYQCLMQQLPSQINLNINNVYNLCWVIVKQPFESSCMEYHRLDIADIIYLQQYIHYVE